MKKLILVISLLLMSGCFNAEIGQDVQDIKDYLDKNYPDYTNLEIRTWNMLGIYEAHDYVVTFIHNGTNYKVTIDSGRIRTKQIDPPPPPKTPSPTIWAKR